MSRRRLPKFIVSSVIRSAYQGESHGGVYLVDLAGGEIEQLLDWNDPSIDWEGRGGDRGLRGIAFHGETVFLAASDEIFAYDRHLAPIESFHNPYLRHCHEIFVDGDRLFATSTGFDSILEFDIPSGRFLRGYLLRYATIWKLRRTLGIRPRPRFWIFDPEKAGGPEPRDSSHVNSVTAVGGVLYVSGTRLGHLWRIRDGRLQPFARMPYGSHNARPFRDGVLFNHTPTDRIIHADRRGHVRVSLPLPRYDRRDLVNADLPEDLARQAFGRGLTVLDDELVVGGSSPATVSVYRLSPPETLVSLTVSMDVRNAIHGLEIWPFD